MSDEHWGLSGQPRACLYLCPTLAEREGFGEGYVPMHLDMGEAFQSDWRSENAVIGSLRRRLDLACTKFAASRAFVLSAYYNQAHEMFF